MSLETKTTDNLIAEKIENLQIDNNLSPNINDETKECDCKKSDCNESSNKELDCEESEYEVCDGCDGCDDCEYKCDYCHNSGKPCSDYDCDFYDEKYQDIFMRGKHIFDGSKTIDDMIENLQQTIKYLEELKKDNWQIRGGQVDDDYIYIYNEDLTKYEK